MSRAELEKRILRLHKGGTGILKIGKALGIGTGTVQRVVMEQPRPFDVGVAERRLHLSEMERTGHGTNPRIWISLSLVTARGERNAATRWKRATGQGSARE
jgi:hypothetical protein